MLRQLFEPIGGYVQVPQRQFVCLRHDYSVCICGIPPLLLCKLGRLFGPMQVYVLMEVEYLMSL